MTSSSPSNLDSPSLKRASRTARPLIFRAAAVLLGLGLLGLAEFVLRFIGWPGPHLGTDPFVGFSAVEPLFKPADPGTMAIAESRFTFFRPESFQQPKPADEFRIFCLGGSTVQGRPYAIETSFTTWLEISLQQADRSKSWNVINCGGVSYASYRLVPILQECLDYDPDLFIIYTGQNEFLEARTYEHLKELPGFLPSAFQQVSQLYLFESLYLASAKLGLARQEEAAANRPVLPQEVDALLDYRGGLEHYHRDLAWQEEVIAHFDYNLRRMVQLARKAGVPVVLVNPTYNLRDCPPFKSALSSGLSEQERKQWYELWERARVLYSKDLPEAIALLRRAHDLDSEHAGLNYDLAKCYDTQGIFMQARMHYVRAKELDICPLRILAPMNRTVLRVAADFGTPVVDVEKLFTRLSQHGIPGGNLLVDHVHPSFEGHKIIAEVLFKKMVELGMVRATSGWESHRDAAYARHFGELDEVYFARGQERLRGLRMWAAGRANLIKGSDGKIEVLPLADE